MSTICVVGAGRMGSIYGGLLAMRGGLQVTLFDSWREHIDAIRRDGLHLDGIGGDRRIEIAATSDVEEIQPCLLAIILVDTSGTQEAAAVAKRILLPSGYALTLQNGIGNIETLSTALGQDRVLAGLSYHSGAMVGPGHVTHTHAGPTYLGELDGTTSGRLSDLESIFEDAALDPVVVDNVTGHIWEKWVHNCAINAISAVSGLRVGEISRTPAADELQSHIIEEALAVIEAKRVSLPEANALKAIKAFCRIKFNKPSMLQHMEEGRQTEVDALNGAVVAAGRSLGIDTPYNEAITLMVKAREAYMRIASSNTPIDYETLEKKAKQASLEGGL